MSTRVQNSPIASLSTAVDTNFQPDEASGPGLPSASYEPVMFSNGDLTVTENMANTLEQILDILRGSTIAEERGKDVESKFWATYKKVSNERDDDFLGRANDDMGIILTFAGLFSAVNSTFIIGMQPNPGDTTNALMLQLITIIANGPDSVNIDALSSSTTYSSAAWMQTLSYASLSFSVLAAFGAVMGKQWLNSYKTACGQGSLEERGMQRQKKLDELEYWRLKTVLKAFLVLLQISLFLFGLSLSAKMWTQQTMVSIVIISTTAFGILCYMATIFVSVLHPDSPFQTAGSAVVAAICTKIHPRLTYDKFIKSSAIRWLLETSTNPDIVEAAAGMIPLAQWPPGLDASVIYSRLLDTFTTYRDRKELFVRCGKAMAHLCTQSVKINPVLLRQGWVARDAWGGKSRFIRDAFIAGCDAWKGLAMAKGYDDQQKFKAGTRTALRTMVVHGQWGCDTLPDDERVIWSGDLQWRHKDGRTPSYEEFDWLVDCLDKALDNATEDGTRGDALLALSAMHGLGSDAKRPSYVTALIRCMAPTRPLRVRYAAVRAISDAREELSSITDDSMPHGVDSKLLDELSSALLIAARPNDDQMFDYGRSRCYLRLIFVLAKNNDWRRRLTHHGHVQQFTFLSPSVLASWELCFYIAGICLHIDPSGNDPSLNPIQERWGPLMWKAWSGLSFMNPADRDFRDCLEILPALVTATKQNLPGPDNGVQSFEMRALARDVDRVLRGLQKHDGLDGTVISAVQGFSASLNGMLEYPKPPYSSRFFG